MMPQGRATMAIVYDFDGTLAPGNLQENSFIPDIGMEPAEFWNEVNQLAKSQGADPILMYMYLMLEKARAARKPVHPDDFRKRGATITFFEGVEAWFDRIDRYGKDAKVNVEHYIVSSGNSEIIEGTKIASKFKRIYASRFLFDENNVACWPALAINFTTKTQFIFRINKGAHDVSDDREINRFVELNERPIPFENMVYIGDGETDVPCFRLIKDLGGLSIAVFKPRSRNSREKANGFVRVGRVHCIAAADYSEGGELDKILRAQIDLVAARSSQSLVLANSQTQN